MTVNFINRWNDRATLCSEQVYIKMDKNQIFVIKKKKKKKIEARKIQFDDINDFTE